MRTSELKEIEAARAAEHTPSVPAKGRRKRPAKGWDPNTLRGEIEQEFRENGAKVIREEKPK